MKGISTSIGIGIGKAYLYKPYEVKIDKKNIENTEAEIARLDNGMKKALTEISSLYDKSLMLIGKVHSEIFLAHKLILEDPEFIKATYKMIVTDKVCCEWAVEQVFKSFIELFSNIEDEYLKARVLDLKDVSDRLIRVLMDAKDIDLSLINESSILIAKELIPSDTFRLNKEMIGGFVTETGGKTSHTAIIARALDIPAISGIKNIFNYIKDGDILIVDATVGNIIINPTDLELKEYENKKRQLDQQKLLYRSLIGEETVTKDGFKIELSGNVGSLDDIEMVLENDGEGVGLFRTEFVYMNKDKLPTEEEQFQIYKKAAIRLEKRPLIIRTMDVGGDKDIPYLNLPKEMNPFLGYRAIRVSLDRKSIFITQLRAILRASFFGNIKVMFPMISQIEEIREIKKILSEIKITLRQENIPFNEDIEIGIMVEVPAVAIQSRSFAREVDFFSIGTNDLIQYTLAVDRGNQDVEYLYNQYHPAVLNLINMTIENAHKEGIWVGMCGEAAADERLVPIFLAMGLDEFSMNSSSILRIRKIIRESSKNDIELLLDHILSLPSSEDVKKILEDKL